MSVWFILSLSHKREMLLKTFDVFWLKFCLFLLLQWSHSALNLHILGYQWVFKKSSFVYVLFCKGYVDDYSVQFHSVAQSCWTLRPHGLQHARFPCPSPTLRAYSNIESVMSSNHLILCHPVLFLLSIFPSIRVFSSESSSSHQVAKVMGVSASTSVLPMNIQDWFI